MKKPATLLAITLIAASVGCRSSNIAGRAVAPDPVGSAQISYVFDDALQTYFGPKYDYFLDDGFRGYFGSNEALVLAEALRKSYPGYQIDVHFAGSVK